MVVGSVVWKLEVDYSIILLCNVVSLGIFSLTLNPNCFIIERKCRYEIRSHLILNICENVNVRGAGSLYPKISVKYIQFPVIWLPE